MKKNTIGNISFAIVLLIGLSFISCQDTLFDDAVGAQIDESNLIDARIAVKVNELNVNSSTREAEPSNTPEEATEQEKKVDDIWVFQYDTSGNLLIKPRYYIASESENEDSIWDVTLKSNVSSYIYVVTNTQDNTWASNYESFNTINKLKQEKLSDPRVIVFDSSTNDEYIPMEGVTENAVVPSDVETITVPVTRMYAKLKIKINLAEILDDYYDDVEVSYVNIESIPYYCRVASLAEDETSSEDAVSFPTGTEFQSRAFLDVEADDEDEDYYPYVLYVPENLQGESENENTSPEEKGSTDDAPKNAISVTARISFKNLGEDEELTTLYVVYPGGNNYNNFNIRRNDVYRITLDVGYPLEETAEPSANCIFGFAGETISFYPYYREEIGGNGSDYYNFSSYLDPEVDSLKIDNLKIIWQTKDCIGDNTEGDKVYIEQSTTQSDPIKQYKIYVKTLSEGNALVGAYNSNGDILWSWHIWVRNKAEGDPTNIANAKTFYTYNWDENGIYGRDSDQPRVLGNPIMNCNIGALQDEPSSYNTSNWNDVFRTYGMLYQWGRKDPFPPASEGYYFVNYDNDHSLQVYENDNNTLILKTSYGDSDEYNDYLFRSHIPTSEEGINYTIANPTIFMCGTKQFGYTIGNESDDRTDIGSASNYNYNQDWMNNHDDYLWGGIAPSDNLTHYQTTSRISAVNQYVTLFKNYGDEKTIFDPCPYGWRVSSGDIWLGFVANGLTPAGSLDNINYDGSKSILWGMTMYIDKEWRSGNSSWFPTQGVRPADGSVYRVRNCGPYSNATTDYNNIIHSTHIHYNTTSNFQIFYTGLEFTTKASAAPIRCVRETK